MKLISWRSLIILILLSFLLVFSYRWSEQYGTESQRACALAMRLTLIASVLGLLPLLLTRKRNRHILFSGILIGAMLRVLITASGVLFVSIKVLELRTWFFGWAAGYYLLFLVLETVLAVTLLHNNEYQNEGSDLNDNGIDFSKYESS